MRGRALRRPGPLGVIASNAVAPVGVVALGWSPVVFLGVFVLELAAVLFWSAAKIPFAAKRPNNALDDHRLLGPLQAKRGGFELPGPFPSVYLRNLPTFVTCVFLVAPLELGAAFAAFALPDPHLTTEIAGQMLLGGVGVFVGRGIETWAAYFRDGGYREHSPRSVLLVPFEHLFGVGALLLLVGPFAADGTVVLAGIVAGKLAWDLRTIQVERDEDERGLFYRLYGSKETETPAVPVVEPDGEPTLRVRPGRSVAVADALYRGVAYTLTSSVLLVYAAGALVAVFGPPRLVLVPLALVLPFAALRAVSRYLRYGTLEYRCYDGVLVAYDALLAEPQDRLERSDVRTVAVDNDLVDRAFGTATVEFDRGSDDPTMRLTVPDPEDVERPRTRGPLSAVHVDDPEAIADELGVGWQFERDVERAAATS